VKPTKRYRAKKHIALLQKYISRKFSDDSVHTATQKKMKALHNQLGELLAAHGPAASEPTVLTQEGGIVPKGAKDLGRKTKKAFTEAVTKIPTCVLPKLGEGPIMARKGLTKGGLTEIPSRHAIAYATIDGKMPMRSSMVHKLKRKFLMPPRVKGGLPWGAWTPLEAEGKMCRLNTDMVCQCTEMPQTPRQCETRPMWAPKKNLCEINSVAGGDVLPQMVCADAMAGDDAVLQCPEGVITSILFASYGQPQGACNTKHYKDTNSGSYKANLAKSRASEVEHKSEVREVRKARQKAEKDVSLAKAAVTLASKKQEHSQLRFQRAEARVTKHTMSELKVKP
jgi:hypothetical protein